MKKITFLISLIFILFLTSCGQSKKANDIKEYPYNMDWKPNIESTDRMITYYVISNPQKFVTDEPYTTDDLKESGNLLVTAGGVLKAVDLGNWRKVEKYFVRTACVGWKRIEIEYISIFGDEQQFDIYLPDGTI